MRIRKRLFAGFFATMLVIYITMDWCTKKHESLEDFAFNLVLAGIFGLLIAMERID